MNLTTLGDRFENTHIKTSLGFTTKAIQSVRNAHSYETRRIPQVDTVTLNGENNFDLKRIDFIPEDMYIAVRFTAAITGPTTPGLVLTPYWLNKFRGVELLYKNKVVYTMPEAWALIYHFHYEKNLHSVQRRQNDESAAVRQGTNTANPEYYINLKPIANIIKNLGAPLNIYDDSSWTVRLNLKPLAEIVDGGSSTAGSGSLSVMELVVTGERIQDADSVNKLKAQLNGSGLSTFYLEPIIKTSTYAASATQAIVQDSTIRGPLNSYFMITRETASLSSAPDTLNPLDFNTYEAATDTVQFGTVTDHVKFTGQAFRFNDLLEQQADKWMRGNTFVDADAAKRQNSILLWSFSDSPLIDEREGVSGGHQKIDADFRLQLDFGSTVTADTVDELFLIERTILVKNDTAHII